MWRVSADFWDRWEDLSRSFQLLDKWSPFIGVVLGQTLTYPIWSFIA
ncbi:hypothetical protein [Saccharobesus litoralis]|nr:hypothetical protein [Saccharobesus litoralis]